LEIIGEAFVQLRVEDAATAEKFPDLRQIVGMRNRLVHGYYDTRNSYSSALA
jgi:uncharacterized protein with HEPN domain